MCQLCGPDEAEMKGAREHARNVADSLKRLASGYERLASGSIQPHSEEWSSRRISATWLIRELVEDWV